jgi:hypothetical protein
MHGSSVEYLVQIRVQDYWIDYGRGLISGEFRYREDAEKHLEKAKIDKPNRDFRLVKRITTFRDETVA